MKRLIICSVILIITMIGIPFFVSFVGNNSYKDENSSISEEKNISKKDIIRGMLLAKGDEKYSMEYYGALCILMNSNYNRNKISLDNEKEYISNEKAKKKFDNSFEEIKDKINKAIDKYYGMRIYYKSKAVNVPVHRYTNGKTANSKDKAYLVSCSSPWDSGMGDKKVHSGVSLYGVRCMVDIGITAKNALLHYLPLCKVREYNKII